MLSPFELARLCYERRIPSRLDHDERRTELAEAVWRLIRREGVRGASVRAVAREAGLSMGSVRYFFSTQDELLQFAMRAIITRAAARMQSRAADRDALVSKGDAGEAAAQVLSRLGPIAEDRDLDLDLEIERLWSLLDGLTLHILLQLAPTTTTQRAGDILRTHLRDLQHPAT